MKILKVLDLSVPRNLNPILAYYYGDRLFKFDGSNVTYTVIFNNNITK